MNDAHPDHAMQERRRPMKERFRTAAAAVSCAFGSPWALALAVAVVVAWAASGRYFGYSDAWQLVINTGTTIVTFLMAFLIQATQYRESRAINLKIDELIRAVEGARNGFVNLEQLPDDKLDTVARELSSIGANAKIAPLQAAASAVDELSDAIDDLQHAARDRAAGVP